LRSMPSEKDVCPHLIAIEKDERERRKQFGRLASKHLGWG